MLDTPTPFNPYSLVPDVSSRLCREPTWMSRTTTEHIPGQLTARYTFVGDAMTTLSSPDRRDFERFSQGRLAFVSDACIHHAFEAQAAANPYAIAVYHRGDAVTYRTLQRQANRLAALLARHGVSTGDNVALFVDRSIAMVVGILAVLEAGAAYVPQSVESVGESRLARVIDVAATRVILTLSHLRSEIPVPEDHVCIAIDEVMSGFLAENLDDDEYDEPFAPDIPVCRDDICYIHFGDRTAEMFDEETLDGVRVTHGNLCNLVLTEPGDFGLRPGRRMGQIFDIARDAAAWEILGCLGNGATLVMGDDLLSVVESVDVLLVTPAILGELDVPNCYKLDILAVVDGPCPREVGDRWAGSCAVYQFFGATEATIASTARLHAPDDELLTMGVPISNNTVYILDPELEPCAIGDSGEIWLGGDCVSAGYLEDRELTEERYRPDPFLGGDQMMVRTRDLGAWTEGGELVHLGRIDE